MSALTLKYLQIKLFYESEPYKNELLNACFDFRPHSTGGSGATSGSQVSSVQHNNQFIPKKENTLNQKRRSVREAFKVTHNLPSSSFKGDILHFPILPFHRCELLCFAGSLPIIHTACR